MQDLTTQERRKLKRQILKEAGCTPAQIKESTDSDVKYIDALRKQLGREPIADGVAECISKYRD